MEFLGVDYEEDMGDDEDDGLIGLGVSSDSDVLFVDKLFEAGLITDRVFSTYFTEHKHENHIYFGGFSEDYASEDDFTYIDLKSDDETHWTLEMDVVKYGDLTLFN